MWIDVDVWLTVYCRQLAQGFVIIIPVRGGGEMCGVVRAGPAERWFGCLQADSLLTITS